VSLDKSKINPNTYQKLISFYKKDVRALENLLHLQTGWLKKS